jgi:hypothetical protein
VSGIGCARMILLCLEVDHYVTHTSMLLPDSCPARSSSWQHVSDRLDCKLSDRAALARLQHGYDSQRSTTGALVV